MAFLIPDNVINCNGVLVKQYFLHDHNVNKISLPTIRTLNCTGVTMHNTEDIKEAAGTTDAEQYTRSTVNGNMNDVVVHYYVDKIEAWQDLNLNSQSWHAGHRGVPDRNGSELGNKTTISIECIMSGSKGYEKAEDNAARLAAYVLHEYKLDINHLFTHNYWENIRQGKTGTVDYLNTLDDGYKKCPIYIRPHWFEFKEKVNSYLKILNGETTVTPPEKMYYVQVGAFKNKQNAENYLAEAKKKYPTAFIKEFK